MKYSRQDLFRFRAPNIDSALQQKLQNLRLCRRPRGIKASRRHSRCTAKSAPHKCINNTSLLTSLLLDCGMLFQLLAVLPSVSDTGLSDIRLHAACVNTGLLTYSQSAERPFTNQ
jgi:hypothetical protein